LDRPYTDYNTNDDDKKVPEDLGIPHSHNINNEKLVIEHTADEEEPSEEEKKTLRRVGEWLPWSAWLVAIVEFCERFTYYGCQGIFQNYAAYKSNGESDAIGLSKAHHLCVYVRVCTGLTKPAFRPRKDGSYWPEYILLILL
jgi:hypothetical protein